MTPEDIEKPRLPASYVLLSLDLAAESGVDRARILQDLPISEALLAQPETRVSLRTYGRIVARCLRLTGDPLLGLAFGLRSRLTAHGLLGLGFMTQATLGDALRFGERYFVKLRYPGFQASLAGRASGQGMSVIDVGATVPYGPLREYAFDVVLAGFTHVLDQVLDHSEYRLLFERPEPPGFDSYRAQLPEVRFEAGANQIQFPSEALQRPLPDANAVTAHLVREQCDQELAVMGLRGDIPARVRAQLAGTGERAYPSLEQAAVQLCMSSRSLKRHLHKHGLSYRQLLQEARYRESLRLLANTNLPIAAIAQRMGYRNPANFTRAFRHWANEAPDAMRRRLQRP